MPPDDRLGGAADINPDYFLVRRTVVVACDPDQHPGRQLDRQLDRRSRGYPDHRLVYR